MRLQQLTESQQEQYQSFVQANGYFLQSWDWGDFQKSLGQQVVRFLVFDDLGKVVMSAQFLIHAALGKKYFFAPYGPVVLEGLDKDVVSVATEFLFTELKKLFPDLLFARIEPFVNNDGAELMGKFKGIQKSLDLNPHQTLVLNLEQPLEQILTAMHPKTRYNIKVAEKKGVTVKVLESSDVNLENAVQLFITSSNRASIRAFPKKYYSDLINYFSEANNRDIKAKLYTAWSDQDLIAANLMLYYKDTAVYLFGGTAGIKRNLMAPYLLHFQAINDAQAAGLKSYDFWGVEPDPNHPWYGFSKFKLGFGGEVIKRSGTLDFVLEPAWYNVYKILRVLNRLVKR